MNLTLIYLVMAISFAVFGLSAAGAFAAESMCKGSKREKDDALALFFVMGLLTFGLSSLITIISRAKILVALMRSDNDKLAGS